MYQGQEGRRRSGRLSGRGPRRSLYSNSSAVSPSASASNETRHSAGNRSLRGNSAGVRGENHGNPFEVSPDREMRY